MYSDFIDLIALLNKHKAKYLVIGGYAVGIHAQPRVTKDLDIFILPTPRNAEAIFRALQEFGAPLRTRVDPGSDPKSPTRPLTAKDFEDKDSWFMMGVPPMAVDILANISGMSFNAAWKNRVTHIIDEKRGISAQFIAREDLIAAKLAAGRPQDLADVDALLKAASAAAPAKPVVPKMAKPKAKPKKTEPKP
jgi:Nucleotidyl transferase AbiEii toxin, Type IV TA system